MILKVYLPHMLIVKETQVVDGVAREPRQVERNEVKVEANDRLPFEVDVALGVEGDRPSDEVNPAHHRAESLQPGAARDGDVNDGCFGQAGAVERDS